MRNLCHCILNSVTPHESRHCISMTVFLSFFFLKVSLKLKIYVFSRVSCTTLFVFWNTVDTSLETNIWCFQIVSPRENVSLRGQRFLLLFLSESIKHKFHQICVEFSSLQKKWWLICKNSYYPSTSCNFFLSETMLNSKKCVIWEKCVTKGVSTVFQICILR